MVLIHNPQSELSFARAGDDKWTCLPSNKNYEDCSFQGGYLYASTRKGEIHSFALHAPAVEQKIVLGEAKGYLHKRIYIVPLPGPFGELLQISRSDVPQGGDGEDEDSDFETELGNDSYLSKTSTINVHKVDISTNNLVEVSSLGETVFSWAQPITLPPC